jgi:cystathionine gamma-synthase
MVFVETPTNPMMLLTDIAKVKKTIDSQTLSARKILLVVDNTFLTPYYQKPLSLGADISCHSATKYLGGHNDTLAGLAIYKDRKIFESQMHDSMTTGAVLSPFDSFLTLRGIKTLPLRMDKITANARRLAKFLSAHPRVGEVYFAGKGGMISFAVDSENTVRRILKNVKIISFAESLGGVETLITYPTTQTHADVPEKERLARGITPTLLRLSCGIENYKDLEEDLGGALD